MSDHNSAPTPNTRLQQALIDSGLTPQQLAERLEVDPKTVERWINTGRTPFPVHRFAITDALGCSEAELWPGAGAPRKGRQPSCENSRLRRAIFDAKLTPEQLAEALEVRPKTVQRWLTKGTVPYLPHQRAVAVAVGIPETELWPTARRHWTHDYHAGSAASSQDHQTDQQQSATGDAGDSVDGGDRIRALMSWVDDTAPLKERDIHPHTPTSRGHYSRSYGVERSR
ncbi:helix-turn-helix transcriptional regulator [Nocardia xishanensis]|uniref:helix-turn-helix transcriptional regulator n=1 Tax=Nocardia xishanensis TaxID=238964 RepID=UPI0034163EBE